MPTERREFLGVGFDLLPPDVVLRRLARVTPESAYSYVVTPNVDHLVRIHDEGSSGPLKPLYDSADLCLCDSKVLHLIGKLRGLDLPVVPGSELTALMFERLVRPADRIAVLGGDRQLVERLRALHPEVEFVQHIPPMGLRTDAAARETAARFIVESGARFTFIAVGSPQQEMIAAQAKSMPGAKGMALCVGASLEFLTGQTKRAPRLVQRLSLEWAHRLLSDPKRLWRRYLVQGPRIFLIAYRWPGAANGAGAK